MCGRAEPARPRTGGTYVIPHIIDTPHTRVGCGGIGTTRSCPSHNPSRDTPSAVVGRPLPAISSRAIRSRHTASHRRRPIAVGCPHSHASTRRVSCGVPCRQSGPARLAVGLHRAAAAQCHPWDGLASFITDEHCREEILLLLFHASLPCAGARRRGCSCCCCCCLRGALLRY